MYRLTVGFYREAATVVRKGTGWKPLDARTGCGSSEPVLPLRRDRVMQVLGLGVIVSAWLAGAAVRAEETGAFLWQIGSRDTNYAEFALAPNEYSRFSRDGFFVVGESDPKQDWPYVQPGPDDSWAGNARHNYVIVFALKSAPDPGTCRLEVNLVDTHSQAPPTLTIRVNGTEFNRSLPKGHDDDSLNGNPGAGYPHDFSVQFPSDLLHAGYNDIQIVSTGGSWMIYDWLGLKVPAGTFLAPVSPQSVILDVETIPGLVDERGKMKQPILVHFRHFGKGKAEDVSIRADDAAPERFKIEGKNQTVELLIPAVSQTTTSKLIVESQGQVLATRTLAVKPVPKMTVYVLPHSHTDIGYTTIQSEVEKKQVNNLLKGIEEARRTANYPEGSRFVWNIEVLWAADLYLHRLNDQQRADFFDAVKRGQVALNGMYLNELSGLCRPEELLQLFRFGTQLSEKTGVPIESAMISDVPGYTWGMVTAMSQAGIKYFSTAPNSFDRIGTIMRDWEDKPFYWEGPDGKSRVLAWIPYKGYSLSHSYSHMSPRFVGDLFNALERKGYPYDITYLRWSGHGDNATPDPEICDFIRDWNSKYIWPKFIISGTTAAFKAMETRYGSKLPVVRGDWSPYWEDGAGSSAKETAENRQSSDRLTQAETAFAMLDRSSFPADDFRDAWCKVLLYSEHTWGAWCSIDQPENPETLRQWEVKKSYADRADEKSRDLLAAALDGQKNTAVNGGPAEGKGELEVINTLAWPRTTWVTARAELSAAGDRVKDEHNEDVLSQRLTSGELIFLADDVPSLGSRKFRVLSGGPKQKGAVRVTEDTLENGKIAVRVDRKTGEIVELKAKGIENNFVDSSGGESLNEYDYLIGDNLKDLSHNGPVRISIGEKGPLMASLIIESDAPGCKTLRRELRMMTEQDFVEVIDLVDKARLQSDNYRANHGKESVNFAFPFNVPDGNMVVDLPLGTMQPETDQIPSACKNWTPVGRWVDVSNDKIGITWVTPDAPLIEIGELSARLLNSQTNPDVWRKHIGRTQKFYSWVMNNHWGTNYRAYQEEPVAFRFILRPHQQFDPAEATRFSTGFSQPLLVRTIAGKAATPSILQVLPASVLVTCFKPSDDGKAWMISLFGASEKPASAKLVWGSRSPKALFISGTNQKPGLRADTNQIEVPGHGVVTMRAELE
ncbi:MAG TPA: polysaccharide lyase family protein [Verrucomicrobiae bacterium]|nr:polysaccharide lyase family protein [Verrucomicrobiae bacterium]